MEVLSDIQALKNIFKATPLERHVQTISLNTLTQCVQARIIILADDKRLRIFKVGLFFRHLSFVVREVPKCFDISS